MSALFVRPVRPPCPPDRLPVLPSYRLPLLLPPMTYKRLRLYAQCIGHAGYIVEIRHDLRDVVDGHVVEPMVSQLVEVRRARGMRIVGQPRREAAKRTVRLR